MRKILLAAVAVFTVSSALAGEAPAIEADTGGLVEAAEALRESLDELPKTVGRIEAIHMAFEKIRICEAKKGTWQCQELSERLMNEIKEKYGIE